MCLKCNTDIMKVIIDWFGQDIHTIQCKNCCFVADVFVSVSPTFYAWIFTYGANIQILSPDNVREEYANRLKAALQQAE